MLRLGVNIDHVATIRQARGGREPDPVWAAAQAELAGADGITIHLAKTGGTSRTATCASYVRPCRPGSTWNWRSPRPSSIWPSRFAPISSLSSPSGGRS